MNVLTNKLELYEFLSPYIDSFQDYIFTLEMKCHCKDVEAIYGLVNL